MRPKIEEKINSKRKRKKKKEIEIRKMKTKSGKKNKLNCPFIL
jgi:hypothetical protein